MIIGGLQKLTLLDYPAHTACTIFLKGCNFRCPFCHNVDLLEMKPDQCDIPYEEIMSFLDERKGKLEGVCITGGEPLINDINELKTFIKDIKDRGYLVKLDTNGYYPEKLKELIPYVDYVAMDIKSGREKYSKACGINIDISKIMESIEIIKSLNDYEFRTTLVKGLHDDKDFYDIKEMIKGTKKYYYQNYHHVDGMKELPYKSFLKEEIEHFRDIVEKGELRGIDG